MKRIFIIFLLWLIAFYGNTQNNWKWKKLAPLPLASANNAVCEATINENKYVYSFGGIGDSLSLNSFHQKIFKYNVIEDTWLETTDVPGTHPKIGNAASFVKNKIYLIGGKYIKADSTEVTSNKIQVYNPFIDTFEVDPTPLPTPVYGHVQGVWKDSLIYVVAGSNNTGNIPDVQIYNPYFDSWESGTPIPYNSNFRCVGASGYILDNTIYYFGGAIQSLDTTTTNFFRKGVINPDDPTQITWSTISFNSGDPIYRGACSGHNNTVFWIGGSKEAYNFDAIDYQTSNSVTPNQRIMEYNVKEKKTTNIYNTPYSVMDLKGIAKIGGGNWIITGGIDSLQQASNQTFLLHNPSLSNIEKATHPPYFEVVDKNSYFIIETKNVGKVTIYDMAGRTLFQTNKNLANLYIPKSQLSSGILLFTYNDDINLPVTLKKVNPR